MIRLALLWHMHQPFYQDLSTGEHVLPWVRLHALKDYRGMVDALQPYPRVRATFNLVPSLLVQLQAFAEGRARDRHHAVGLVPAAALSLSEREFLGANGFHAAYPRMIEPFSRYRELRERRDGIASWPIEDLRDLQVWHKLVWVDPDWREGEPRVRQLLERGRDFTEADKLALAEVEADLIRTTIPAYQRALVRQQVELATSPFYHPILPLVCDTDAHLAAYPEAERPEPPFRWPADAAEQVARAVRFHRATFGEAPRGLWPSEGSVSDSIVAILAANGLGWCATDEDVLARTLGEALPRDPDGLPLRPEALYRPYELRRDDSSVRVLFRDHVLSDRIGFVYQSWAPADAAEDFVTRVRESGRRFMERTSGEPPTITVILDGENAWEHYAGGGRPFLRELYGRLEAATDIATVTMAEAASGAAPILEHIFPGSWIHADFAIWAGHREDRWAWSQLSRLRAVFAGREGLVPPEARDRAYEEILIAEGSDWFWWYGDDHTSAQDSVFDDLFRRHIRQAYEALGVAAPLDLGEAPIGGAASPTAGGVMARADDRPSQAATGADAAPNSPRSSE